MPDSSGCFLARGADLSLEDIGHQHGISSVGVSSTTTLIGSPVSKLNEASWIAPSFPSALLSALTLLSTSDSATFRSSVRTIPQASEPRPIRRRSLAARSSPASAGAAPPYTCAYW
jgi:hypothetical protein